MSSVLEYITFTKALREIHWREAICAYAEERRRQTFFFTLGKEKPSWIDMALFKIACVFGKFDLVAG